MTQVPGWYLDEKDPYSERYFNGGSWTDQTRPASEGARYLDTKAEPPAKPTPSPSSKPTADAPTDSPVPLIRSLRTSVAWLLLAFGVAFIGGGLAAGFLPVKAGVDASCGSGFQDHADTFALTDSGLDTCAQVRSTQRDQAISLLIIGGVLVIAGGIALVAASDTGAANSRRP